MLTGEYTLKDGKATAFMAPSATPRSRPRRRPSVTWNFWRPMVTRRFRRRRTPGDIPVLVLDNSFEIVLVQGRTLAGVHDATSLAAALDLAGKVRSRAQGEAVNQPKDIEEKRYAPGELNRRDFLKRMGYASALALAAGGLGLALYDAKGPGPGEGRKALTGLGDYARQDHGRGAAKMAIVRGTDRKVMVERGITALGGMESFIQKGDRVLIKVNAAFATPASLGATTNPELLAAVAGLCFKAGAAQVLVTDNPINNPDSCFEITGLAGGGPGPPGPGSSRPGRLCLLPSACPGASSSRTGRSWPGSSPGVNRVIVVSPVKDHQRARASMTLKNFYGFLGGRRNVFHQDINGIITELSQLLKPTLCVLDGTVSMMTNGPTGGSLSDLKETGTMVISTDPVAADAVGVELLGRTLADVPYILMAEKAGAGTADYQRLNPVMIRYQDLISGAFILIAFFHVKR